MGHKWTKFQQSPTNSKVRNEGQKDHYAVSSLIYQSFGTSPVRVELIPRITRFIFPQLKNGLGLEFSVICGQTSPEITTDTRLPKQPRLSGALTVCSISFSEFSMRAPCLKNCDLQLDSRRCSPSRISCWLISFQWRTLRLNAILPSSKE